MTEITLQTGPERRRRWSQEERQRIVSAAFAPSAVVADVARQLARIIHKQLTGMVQTADSM
jgi:transposase-like protein